MKQKTNKRQSTTARIQTDSLRIRQQNIPADQRKTREDATNAIH